MNKRYTLGKHNDGDLIFEKRSRIRISIADGKEILSNGLKAFNTAAVEFDRKILVQDDSSFNDMLIHINSEITEALTYIRKLKKIRANMNESFDHLERIENMPWRGLTNVDKLRAVNNWSERGYAPDSFDSDLCIELFSNICVGLTADQENKLNEVIEKYRINVKDFL